MEVKEYLKAQYNLKNIEASPFNFELLVLDKLYGKKINVPEWYDNIKVDNSEDGGIDFIIVDIDGQIIPLLENNSLSKALEDILFEKKSKVQVLKKIYDEKGELNFDNMIDLLIKKVTDKGSKLTVDFIQSKSGNSIQERVLLKIKDTLDDLVLKNKIDSVLYDVKLKKNISFIKKLVEKISINDGAIEINFKYITINDDVQNKTMLKFNEFAKNIEDIMKTGFNHSHVRFEFLYGSTLIQNLEFSGKRILNIMIKKGEMVYQKNLFCIGLVELQELEKFVTFNGELDISLFDGNVRDSYTISSPINRDIRDTLKSKIRTKDFWWLNNGITIICNSLEFKNGKMYVKEPQLVNGLQSAVTIFDTLRAGDRINEHKKILIRFLVENQNDNIDTIIKTTNTQNPVDIYLLSSTKQIHRDIEQAFLSYNDGYYYDRRKNYYRNINKNKLMIFDIKYTFKTYSSIFLKIPSEVRTSTKTNFKNKHNDVFNDSINKDAYLYSDILDRNIQRVLRNSIIDKSFKEVNGVSIITYSLHLALIYTSLVKKTINYNDKYISKSDIGMVEKLKIEDENLKDSINILNSILLKYPNDNKVYLARTSKIEDDIKAELIKYLNSKNKEG